MRHIDVDRKRAGRWPWVLGLGILVLVVWGVTILLRPPVESEAPAVGTTAADTLPPAMIPSETDEPATGGASGAAEDTISLGEERLGETVRVQGEVVATGNDAFWILIDSRVLRVDSPRRARRGDTLAVRGTLREADAATTDRLASTVMSRHPEFDSWTIVRVIKLVEEGVTGISAAGAGA